MTSSGLFKSILVPFDGSPSSRKALDIGLQTAKLSGAELALLTVEEYVPHFAGAVGEVEEEKERQDQYAAHIQREAREAAKQWGMDFSRADILVGHVAQTIVNHARSIQCDLIIIGHSGRSGVWANFLGTTVERVSRHAHCSVLIVRERSGDCTSPPP